MTPTAISKRQRAQLARLVEWRTKQPTVASYLRANWRQIVFRSVVGIVGYGCFIWGGWPIVAWSLLAATVAVFVRDVVWYAALAKAWPLSAEITDWAKVEGLLGRRSDDAS